MSLIVNEICMGKMKIRNYDHLNSFAIMQSSVNPIRMEEGGGMLLPTKSTDILMMKIVNITFRQNVL